MMSPTRNTVGVLLTLAVSACASSGTASAPATVAAPGSSTGAAAASSSTGAAPRTTASASDVAQQSSSAATFSVAQADRGRDTFRGRCTECHYSSEFADSRFRFRWSRRSAGSLYQFIQTSMPETAPGSLSGEEAVELVSYILRMNGFEAGASDLPADRAVLDGIALASLRQP